MNQRWQVQLMLVVLLGVAHAWAQASLDSAVDQLYATKVVQQVAISPDGKRVAWVQPAPGQGGGGSAIFVGDVGLAAAAHRITAMKDTKNCAEGSPAWSADSRQLAFLSDAGGSPQLYIAAAEGGNARQLTNLQGFLSEPRWSPDGKQIALLFTENAPRTAGPLAPMTPEVGVIEAKVFEQRLTTVDVASGKARQISPADMYVYEYDWSPDSKQFAVSAARGEGDAQWYVAELYTLALSGEMKPVYKPQLQFAVPRWSPDGKSIAFISGLMSDEGATGGDIYVVSSAGSEARDLTPNRKASPSWLAWSGPSRIVFVENVDGHSGIGSLDVGSGATQTLWSGGESLGTAAFGALSISLADDRRTSAVIRQSFNAPPEVWAGPIGAWKQVTHLNSALQPNWGKVESVHWTNGATAVQGWLMYPLNYEPSRRYPLVVEVHGGPGSAAVPSWPEPFYDTSVLSGLGYFVLYPNPRGSFGGGESFTKANVKDFGYGDFHDILAGVDYVDQHLPVDPNRTGITGWSYGGYMSMWAVTQTNRFSAAVAGAGIADYLSYYGQNDIDEWMIPFFGASVYDDPAVYARSSPITYIKNVKTPTLVLVGERDGECPAPQSREFWHALGDLGVPTQLVIYPGEGHFIASSAHQRDIIHRMADWFDKYLK